MGNYVGNPQHQHVEQTAQRCEVSAEPLRPRAFICKIQDTEQGPVGLTEHPSSIIQSFHPTP